LPEFLYSIEGVLRSTGSLPTTQIIINSIPELLITELYDGSFDIRLLSVDVMGSDYNNTRITIHERRYEENGWRLLRKQQFSLAENLASKTMADSFLSNRADTGESNLGEIVQKATNVGNSL
jgi:hypothetical protein